MLYGLYEGTPRTEWGADLVPFPNKITLYRIPLEEDFPDRRELAEEVRQGELLRIILHGRDASTHVALGVEVRWHQVSPTGTHIAGCRFTGTTALLAGKILGFVSSGLT
jgi:hypothetical protein